MPIEDLEGNEIKNSVVFGISSKLLKDKRYDAMAMGIEISLNKLLGENEFTVLHKSNKNDDGDFEELFTIICNKSQEQEKVSVGTVLKNTYRIK